MLASEVTQNQLLNDRAEALAAENAELVKAVTEQRAAIERLEKLVEEERSSRRQAEAAIAMATASAGEQRKLRELNEEQRRAIERLEAVDRDQRSTIEQLEAAAVGDQQDAIERLEAAIRDQRSHIEQLESLNVEQQRVLKEAERQMQESQQGKAQLEQKLRAQVDELVASRAHIQEADKVVMDANARIAALEVLEREKSFIKSI